ncbi:signal peptidase II [Haloactinomyces albus]|uniref:Lipoprotein signal peptidase n=1 Tax=Haloactinomyces albus TaxID=1352928 RepID=A0AAE3Z904_9ACTN|nr:signal peptidase II [Haloactinomyces albus]MDR7300557.1 signal peptidase II [Haloactinomyces albus]
MSTEQSEPEQPERAMSEHGSAPEETQESPSRPGPHRRRVLGLLFGIAGVLLALDIVTKSLAVAHLEGEPPVKLLGGALYLVLFRNPGAAFSLATGLTWLLALLAIVVVGVIIWLAPKMRSTGWAVGIGLVLGGASGNLVDRIFREPAPLRGHVIDFLSVFAPDGSVWPVFNLADSGIVCGGILVVLLSLLGYDYDGTVHHRRSKQRPAEQSGKNDGHSDADNDADEDKQ